jgi:hypothetical protein
VAQEALSVFLGGLMTRNPLEEAIAEVLRNCADELELSEGEIGKLAVLVSSVARAGLGTRILFYDEVSHVMHEVQKRLCRQRQELLDDLMGRKRQPVLN